MHAMWLALALVGWGEPEGTFGEVLERPFVSWRTPRGPVDLPAVFERARAAAGEEEEAVARLEVEMMPRWMRQRTEVAIARFQLERVLRDAHADRAALQKALRKLRKEREALDRLVEEALLRLHEILGPQRFASLFSRPRSLLQLQGMTRNLVPHLESVLENLQRTLETYETR